MTMQQDFVMPRDVAGASALLRAWGASGDAGQAEKALHCFNQMAMRGYELARAPESAAYWALRSAGALSPHYTIDIFRHTVQARPARHEGEDIHTIACVTQGGVVGSMAGGVQYYASGDVHGSVFHTLQRYNANILRGHFGVNDVPRASEPETVSCRGAFRVTVRFDNGMVTQHVAEDVHLAGLLALKAGFEIELRRRAQADTPQRLIA